MDRFHYTLDQQNTVLALTSEGSQAENPDVVYDYSPYGERSSESLEGTEAAALSPFGFTGAYQFQDGTVHLNHRFHSTFTLGFTQPDPSRQELNNYNYAQCDPVNNTDPTGLNAVTYGCAAASFAGVALIAAGSVGFMAGAGLAIGALVGTGAALQGSLIGAGIATAVSASSVATAVGNAATLIGGVCAAASLA